MYYTANDVPPEINEVCKTTKRVLLQDCTYFRTDCFEFDSAHFKMKYSSSLSSQISRKDTIKASNNNALSKFGINS